MPLDLLPELAKSVLSLKFEIYLGTKILLRVKHLNAHYNVLYIFCQYILSSFFFDTQSSEVDLSKDDCHSGTKSGFGCVDFGKKLRFFFIDLSNAQSIISSYLLQKF